MLVCRVLGGTVMRAVLLIVALDIAGYVWFMHEVGNVANIWSALEVLTK